MEVAQVTEETNPRLFREARAVSDLINRDLGALDWDWAARELVRARRQAFRSFATTGVIEANPLLLFGELLLALNQVRPGGSSRSPELLRRIVARAADLIEKLDFLDDCQTGRRLIVRSSVMAHENDGFFPLSLKYLAAHFGDLSTSGLVSVVPDEGDRRSLFTFEDIDFGSMHIEEDAAENDLVHMFERFVPTTMQLDRIFKHNYRSTRRYAHERNPFAMAILAGWYGSCSNPDELYVERDPDLATSLNRYLTAQGSTSYTGGEFLSEYADSTSLVPFAVRAPSGLLLDRTTLLFFLIYLYGQPVPDSFVSEAGYRSAINAYGDRRGRAFSGWLETELTARGLSVPIKDRVFAAEGERFEYDLIAVHEDHSEILLIEAKYRDMPPSSTAGQALLRNEVESPDGLIAHSLRQMDRLRFFQSHLQLFASELPTPRDLRSYHARSVILTKATPVIDRLDEVEIRNVSVFLNDLGSRGS
jgi:hypothetical protein